MILERDGTVEVWQLDLEASPEDLERAYQLLSEDEQQRAERFRFDDDRRRFVIARAGLRRVVGKYLERQPQDLVFAYSSHGKPHVSQPETDLHFNLSRSHERALV